MRIFAFRALDNDALLRLPLYSRSLRSRSNDSEENARVFANGKRNREKVKEILKKQNSLEFFTQFFSNVIVIVKNVSVRQNGF